MVGINSPIWALPLNVRSAAGETPEAEPRPIKLEYSL